MIPFSLPTLHSLALPSMELGHHVSWSKQWWSLPQAILKFPADSAYLEKSKHIFTTFKFQHIYGTACSKILNGPHQQSFQNHKWTKQQGVVWGIILTLTIVAFAIFLSRLFKYCKTLCKFSFTSEVISSTLLYEQLPRESEKGATATMYSD